MSLVAFDANPFAAAIPIRPNEDQLIKQYMPLVYKTVNQMRSHAGAMMDVDDMLQLGLTALLDSLRRYPGELDAGFISHASQRIRGSILDELRRLDWRSRPVRQLAHQLNDTERALMRKLGRAPSDREVAEAMGITLRELLELAQAAQAETIHSLDELLDSGDHFHPKTAENHTLEQKRWLAAGLATLTEQERLVLVLYYQHELNMKEIAAVLNRTESRVCQLHKQAVANLQSALKRHE